MSGLYLTKFYTSLPLTASLSLAAPVTYYSTNTRQTSGAFRTNADVKGARELSKQGALESAVAGFQRRDPTLSERELTRLPVRAYRAYQHLPRISQAVLPQDNSLYYIGYNRKVSSLRRETHVMLKIV
jgi:hypothetical protein